MACEVIGDGYPRRKDQAIRRDPAPLGLPAEIALGGRIRSKQPKNAVRFRSKQPHPDIEYLRIDLEGIVETAKYEGSLRQMVFGPTRHTFGDGTLVVIGLITVWQPHRALAVETQMLWRDDGPIRDDIVHAIGAHRRRVAQEIDLDGRGATRKHGEAAGERKSHQIDQNIDFTTANERS